MVFRRVAVVLAGGSGTRFWPVSTSGRPKQFLKLASPDATLLEQSVSRIEPLVRDGLYIATAAHLVPATRDAVPEVSEARVFGEPARRNTLGALVWATAHLMKAGDWSEVSVAVLTADHAISPDTSFRETVAKALTIAEETGALVTIGIKPTRPATEYGYIQTGEAIGSGAWQAKAFKEKPDSVTAREFIASGAMLWNSGMFFWTLPAFMNELEKAQPEAAKLCERIAGALSSGDDEGAAKSFGELPAISIDYALMEHADNVAVVEAGFNWDDLGSWDALSRSLERDGSGNVLQGTGRIVDSEDCVVYNDRAGQRVTVLGLEGVVVAVTEDEVLVCSKDRSQDVRGLAD